MKIHIVQPGDTMWELAQKYNTPVERLHEANPHLEDPDKLSAGVKVRIPTGRIPVMSQKSENITNDNRNQILPESNYTESEFTEAKESAEKREVYQEHGLYKEIQSPFPSESIEWLIDQLDFNEDEDELESSSFIESPFSGLSEFDTLPEPPELSSYPFESHFYPPYFPMVSHPPAFNMSPPPFSIYPPIFGAEGMVPPPVFPPDFAGRTMGVPPSYGSFDPAQGIHFHPSIHGSFSNGTQLPVFASPARIEKESSSRES